jgi:ATP-dependent Clp protease ATP-binding subunit ClpA
MVNCIPDKLVRSNANSPYPLAGYALADEGYDPDMGARPLRRVIQQKVEDPLSDALLANDFSNGDVIVVDLNADGDVILRKELKKKAKEPEIKQEEPVV